MAPTCFDAFYPIKVFGANLLRRFHPTSSTTTQQVYPKDPLKMSAPNGQHEGDDVTAKLTRGGIRPHPPIFAKKEEEREWLKFRLAQAFRIFGMSFE